MTAEMEFERCLGEKLRERNKTLKIVSASQWRKAVAPGKRFADAPRSVDRILTAIDDHATKERVDAIKVRYVIVIDVESTDSETQSHSDFGGASGGMIFNTTTEWVHYATFTASVVDVREARMVGSISANASGTSGYSAGVVVLFIIPIPYVLPTSFAGSEMAACSQLAVAVSDFIASGVEPAPSTVRSRTY
jgi:hypothetical protein